MVAKHALIKAINFNQSTYDPVIAPHFDNVMREGELYKHVYTFDNYLTQGVFDYIYSEAEYDSWLNDFIYIIVPSELIPQLTEMVELVEDIEFDDQIDVVLNKQEVTTRNGKTGEIPILSVKFTVCKVLKWETGDDTLLNGIIALFNSLYDPPRHIGFPCKFDSRFELDNFKQSLI